MFVDFDALVDIDAPQCNFRIAAASSLFTCIRHPCYCDSAQSLDAHLRNPTPLASRPLPFRTSSRPDPPTALSLYINSVHYSTRANNITTPTSAAHCLHGSKIDTPTTLAPPRKYPLTASSKRINQQSQQPPAQQWRPLQSTAPSTPPSSSR